MRKIKQLEYLKSFNESRLLEYINKLSVQELEDLIIDIKTYINSEELMNREEKDQYLTVISYVEAKRNGLKQKEGENSSPEDELIDLSELKPLGSNDLIDILGLTIKKDNENKLITFLCMLSAYTEDCQFNISFNAPSSSGKSYIPNEIANYFPIEDVIAISYSSPTAFFHEQGQYEKEKNQIKIDLSRKIIVFMDQPNPDLLERLRSLLSHDKKEIMSKITDKSQRGGNRTKTVVIKGFPVVIFCTAGLRIDEQESTRFILLSPQISQEKIREAVQERIKKSSDSYSYRHSLEVNEERKQLKLRILAIKQGNITEIVIKSPEIVEKMFFERTKLLKPRHTRDVERVMNIIKAFALLNVFFRKTEGTSLFANGDDIAEGFKLWDAISESQELGLPPYIFNLYKEVILPAFEEKNSGNEERVKFGLTRQEILKKHFNVYGRQLSDWQLRKEILPMLENSGSIIQEQDKEDRRKILVHPTLLSTISQSKKQ